MQTPSLKFDIIAKKEGVPKGGGFEKKLHLAIKIALELSAVARKQYL